MSNVKEHQYGNEWIEILENLSFSEQERKTSNAIRFLLANSFPTRKTEEWKYSDLKWLKKIKFTQNSVFDEIFIQKALDTILTDDLKNVPRIVCYNGRYLKQFSTIQENPNFFMLVDYSKNESFINLKNALVALNKIFDNLTITVKFSSKNDMKSILCINLGNANTSRPCVFSPKYHFHILDNVQATILEINYGEGVYFSNSVYDIKLDHKAQLNYTYINKASKKSYYCTNTLIELSDHTKYKQFQLIKGSLFSRYETNIHLKGEWSQAEFDAVQILSDHQHADITSQVIHDVPHCQSHQNVKNILSDFSHGVFQGKVYVNRLAQKTNAQQQNQALLLSDHAEINTKPELEIYADDVKCSHGAAIGALDQEQLFFLMSRGIPYELAQKMLINAFINESIEKIDDSIIQNLLHQSIMAK